MFVESFQGQYKDRMDQWYLHHESKLLLLADTSVFQSRLLLNKKSGLPGSSLTTHLSLDGITTSMVQKSCVVQIFYYFVLATV